LWVIGLSCGFSVLFDRLEAGSAQVRHLALIERARTLTAMKRKAGARRDVGKVLAEDSMNVAAQALNEELSA
jgi:hypothetical protein